MTAINVGFLFEALNNKADVDAVNFTEEGKQNIYIYIKEYLDDYMEQLSNSLKQPAGTFIWFAGNTPPDGFLLCDGRLLSRIEYADLFNAIGTTWGIGDGSTTFKIPDLKSSPRVIISEPDGSNPVGSLLVAYSPSLTSSGSATTSWVGDHAHSFGGATNNTGAAGGHNHSVTTQISYTDTAWPPRAVMLPCIKY